jgi:hypothetical protein
MPVQTPKTLPKKFHIRYKILLDETSLLTGQEPTGLDCMNSAEIKVQNM